MNVNLASVHVNTKCIRYIITVNIKIAFLAIDDDLSTRPGPPQGNKKVQTHKRHPIKCAHDEVVGSICRRFGDKRDRFQTATFTSSHPSCRHPRQERSEPQGPELPLRDHDQQAILDGLQVRYPCVRAQEGGPAMLHAGPR